MSANAQQDFSVDLLRVYYGRLFPYDSMYNWLSYDSAPVDEACCFGRREWSFTIEDDIYIRYQSFSDKEEMMAAIQKRQPHKIDIGAVFTVEPANRTTVRPEAFKTVERELVFDVDMTDYDNIRTCCTGANICKKCWPFMTMVSNQHSSTSSYVHTFEANS
jgi:DNA primase small subunit